MLKTCYLKQEVNNGILVVLQNEPFDNTNPDHLARKEKAEIELGFIKSIPSPIKHLKNKIFGYE